MASTKRRSYLTVQDEALNLFEHFEKVQNRIEDALKQAKLLVTVLKRRVVVDKDHVKAVQKLSQYMHEDPQLKQLKFDGKLESHWSNVKENLAAEAMHVSRIASTLEHQSLQPLQVFVFNDLEKRFQYAVQDGKKVIKDYTNTRAMLQKAKEKYHGCASDWEGSLIVIFHEFGDTWNPIPGSKLHEKENQLCKRMEESKAEYEATVQHINDLQQDVFASQLPKVLEIFRSIGENVVAVVNTALKGFSEMELMLLKGENALGVQHRKQFDAVDHCQSFLFNGISHSEIPSPPAYTFDEFPFKDETLMIQTRKVQYQCMSKLSPQELASRAHRFLAEGEKRSTDRRRSSNVTSGLNPLLVTLCLKYLHQPNALNEEGLFRVSGDSAIIKSIYADFASGKATREYLKAAIMEQMDPNTVSGLLKLHLREHPLLSHCSNNALDKAMNGDKDQVVSIVVSELTSSELNILTDIVKLLNTIVQDPWHSKNKMTARTLGIACGLSLFPQLDPSKATHLTELLIVNYETLRQSHSLL